MINLAEAIRSATQHHQAGRLAEAEALYTQILQQQPVHYDATRLLGIVAAQTGRGDRAAEMLRRAIQLRPQEPVAYGDLAEALRISDKLEEAVAVRLQLVQLQPSSANAYTELGILLRKLNRLDEAAECFRRSLTIRPDVTDVCNLLGVTLADQLRYEESLSLYRRAIEIDPSMDRAHANLAGALLRLGRPTEAESVCRRAIERNPSNLLARAHLGAALIQQRRLEEAAEELRGALKQYPDSPDLHCTMAWLDRLQGDLPAGSAGYEYRWKLPAMQGFMANFNRPFWDGSDLAGRTLLMHFDGGYGDTIQFVRYCALAASRGGKVILLCQPALHRLLSSTPNTHRVVTRLEDAGSYDLVCPLQSAPFVFKTTLQTIPADIPYLFPPAASVDVWKNRLDDDGFTGKRIGILWAGSAEFDLDRQRSLRLDDFEPLSRLHNVRFYNLQLGSAAVQRLSTTNLIDHTAQLKNFAETAALIQNLDAVISPDSAVAHLAGALGKPTYILLPFAPDWRWMLDRDDSPWYPTARLLRQQAPGQWKPVVERLVALLESDGENA